MEERAIASLLREKLRRSIALLSKPEQELIRALYFEELTERQCAEKLGLSQKGINKRKKRILTELKKILRF